MHNPKIFEPRAVATDTEALTSYIPVPSFGVLPVNAFVIRAADPVLVDTGLASTGNEFMQHLRSLIDLRELRWIWLTHMDADHVGNLTQVLAEAPNARVVTTFLGMGKMDLKGLPVDCVYLLNPGQKLDVGDRELYSVTPPSFDAPETTGVFDTRTKALFSADCFGAIMGEPAENAADIAPEDLQDGLITWSTIDAPWVHSVNEGRFRDSLNAVRRLEPSVILSAHLPPAKGMTDTLLRHLAAAPTAPVFEGPDQAALEKMLSAGAAA